MKRADALIPLSKEHHQSLILARLMRKDAPPYNGMPAMPSEKIKYALTEFHSHIQPHFEKEEVMFKMLPWINKQMNILIEELTQEHRLLESYFNKLNSSFPDTVLMDETGRLLDVHIRKEERVLFPLMQLSCTETMLEQIKSLL